jgi:hypothetical protein
MTPEIPAAFPTTGFSGNLEIPSATAKTVFILLPVN